MNVAKSKFYYKHHSVMPNDTLTKIRQLIMKINGLPTTEDKSSYLKEFPLIVKTCELVDCLINTIIESY